ncbi:ABC transporter ATP-binding protein [Streptomyces sp. NPDC005805]|uniref:ABC transporter ATP-binding protein n=1 Tax=Streptomyces sp. NPDC005805 TaxID=3157068 RepID=UPI0033FE1FAD
MKPGQPPTTAPAARLTVEDLSHRADGGRLLVDGVSFTVEPGETLGLVGPNGSGKTTLLRCVYGTLRPTGGLALLDGEDLHTMGTKARARRLATVPQDGHTDFELTVREIVAMGRAPHKRFWEPENTGDTAAVDAALDLVGITGLADRLFPTLSGGERQRALVARAVVQRPALVVLDEPTNHLDIRYQLDVLSLVRGLGTTALLALHDLNIAAYYCDRLLVLDGGRAVAAGPPAEVLTTELLAEVYGVDAEVATHPRTGAPSVTYLPRPHGERRASII